MGAGPKPQIMPCKRMLSPLGIVPRLKSHSLDAKYPTDPALIIDAIDLLHGKRMQSNCIDWSDGDLHCHWPRSMDRRARSNQSPIQG